MRHNYPTRPMSPRPNEAHIMRHVHVLALVLVLLFIGSTAGADPGADPLPTLYELMINGESFLVEANRPVKLESREKPGQTYEVAVRVAPMQRLRLANFQFDYDRQSKLQDDTRTPRRTVRISHELGFTMLINDLGGVLETEAQTEALDVLKDSVVATFQEIGAKKVDIAKPHSRNFANAAARGIVVRYRSKEDFGHTCLIYVLTGKTFTGSCIVQYLDNDKDDVLPLVKRTLDSFRAVR